MKNSGMVGFIYPLLSKSDAAKVYLSEGLFFVPKEMLSELFKNYDEEDIWYLEDVPTEQFKAALDVASMEEKMESKSERAQRIGVLALCVRLGVKGVSEHRLQRERDVYEFRRNRRSLAASISAAHDAEALRDAWNCWASVLGVEKVPTNTTHSRGASK